MMLRTHLAFSFFISLFLIKHFNNLFILIFILATTLPDIDNRHSKLGRYNPFSFLTKHRGMTHTLLFALILAAILAFATKTFHYSYALFFGYSLHIILDSFTKHGTKPFYPFSNFKIRGPMTTNSLTENFLAIILFSLFLIKII